MGRVVGRGFGAKAEQKLSLKLAVRGLDGGYSGISRADLGRPCFVFVLYIVGA